MNHHKSKNTPQVNCHYHNRNFSLLTTKPGHISSESDSPMATQENWPEKLGADNQSPFRLPDLPIGMMEQIFVQSTNLNLLYVNHFLLVLLSRENFRLSFCARVFGQQLDVKHFYPDPGWRRQSPSFRVDQALFQSELARRLWFIASFASRLEAKIPYLQVISKQPTPYGATPEQAHISEPDCFESRTRGWALPGIPNRLLAGS